MIGIGEIKVNGEGKSQEEIKKEIMNQVGEQIDKMFDKRKKDAEKKKVKKDCKSLNKLHILLDESEDKTGFGCQVDIEGNYKELMAMLVCGTASALQSINEGKSVKDAIAFSQLLINEYMDLGDEDDE